MEEKNTQESWHELYSGLNDTLQIMRKFLKAILPEENFLCCLNKIFFVV